jgi:predicted RNase H-like HicB family nuclease
LVPCSHEAALGLAGLDEISEIQLVNEIIFEVTQEADGGFCAECLTESIFTQGDTWDELRSNVKEAVEAFYFDRPKPARIRLHLVRDEMLALG